MMQQLVKLSFYHVAYLFAMLLCGPQLSVLLLTASAAALLISTRSVHIVCIFVECLQYVFVCISYKCSHFDILIT